jgi:hypothetical protein
LGQKCKINFSYGDLTWGKFMPVPVFCSFVDSSSETSAGPISLQFVPNESLTFLYLQVLLTFMICFRFKLNKWIFRNLCKILFYSHSNQTAVCKDRGVLSTVRQKAHALKAFGVFMASTL